MTGAGGDRVKGGQREKDAEGQPTIKDVARLAGVSLGSVSRVVNGKPSVTATVRSRVEAAISELGYKPNVAAQTMRSQVSRTIGCIIRDINIPALAAFVRSAHDVLMEAGYAFLLSNSEGRPDRERKLISTMVSRKADALIVCQYSETDLELENLLKQTGIPIVLVDRELPQWADAVMVDHRGGIRKAAEKLIQFGHRRIALLTGTLSLYPARERIQGYEAAFNAAAIPVDPDLIKTGSFEAQFGFEQTSLLLAQPNRPTAIIAGGIEMLPGVIRAIRVLGLNIPKDVSIVGVLNSDLSEFFDPPITIEHWNYAEVGRLAARFALERIRSGATDKPRRMIVPTDLVLRDSCGPPPSL